MAEIATLLLGALNLLLHFQPIITMETVALDDGGFEAVPPKNMFHRHPNR